MDNIALKNKKPAQKRREVPPQKTILLIRPLTKKGGQPRLYARNTNRGKLIYCFLAALTLVAMPFSINVSAENTRCDDVSFIFARGSGTKPGKSKDFLAYKSAIEKVMRERTPYIRYSLYELGSASHGGHSYPAATVSEIGNALGAYVGAGQAFAYGRSVDEGQEELLAYISEVNTKCPNTKFVLAGFSQGAQVMSEGARLIDQSKLIYVATFGDPKLYLPEGAVNQAIKIPEACFGRNLSSYREDVKDCYVENGILGGDKPYAKDNQNGKLGAWCNVADFMCGSYFDFSHGLGITKTSKGILTAHLSYDSKGAYQDAANVIAGKISAEISAAGKDNKWDHITAGIKPSAGEVDHDLVIVREQNAGGAVDFDPQLIDLAKRTIKEHGRVAVVGLREINQDFSDNPTVYTDFTDDIEEVKKGNASCERWNAFDTSLTTKSIGYVTRTIAEDMKWRDYSSKSIVFFTSNPFSDFTYQNYTVDILRKRGIYVYHIARTNNDSSWQVLTTGSGGQEFVLHKDSPELIADTIIHHKIDGQPTVIERGEIVKLEVTDGAVTIAPDSIEHSQENGAQNIDNNTGSKKADRKISTREVHRVLFSNTEQSDAGRSIAWDLDDDGTFETIGETVNFDTSSGKQAKAKYISSTGEEVVAKPNFEILPPHDTSSKINEINTVTAKSGEVKIAFSSDADLHFISINDAPLGITKNHELTIGDLTQNALIRIVPISDSGYPGQAKTVSVIVKNTDGSPSAPSAGMPRR